MNVVLRYIVTALVGLVVFGLIVFWPAGTFDYWQGWAFIAVFAVSTNLPSIYLLVKNPAALKRRMRAGPAAETRPLQRVIISVALVSMVAMIVVSALDFRFGWSSVPAAMCIVGDVLVAAGLLFTMLVVIQNGYAAANITVESGQELVSTGVYGIVRHPMYLGNIALMIGTPFALGSFWGLVFVIPGLLVLGIRIVDEEKVLTAELAGYPDYARQVHYRLVPCVW
jgi:protein-S-isoprenylcysteine O-methyltransferase Ste14